MEVNPLAALRVDVSAVSNVCSTFADDYGYDQEAGEASSQEGGQKGCQERWQQ